MSQQPLRVLLVDDEASLREPLAKYLRQTHAYQVATAANGQEALDRFEQTGGRYDVALIDDLLVPAPGREPEPLGVALIKKIKSQYPNVEIIIFTGWGMESGLDALRAGAYRYLAKPLNLEELGMLIQAAAEHGRLKGIAREKQILEQLMATSTTLLSGRSLPDVLDTILHGVQAIGFDRVGLYLLSDDRQMMVGQAQVGINPAFVGHERPVATDGHMQILLSDARPHVFEREDDQPLTFEQELEREGVYQWACVPLILHGEVIGELTMDNKTRRRPILESELGPVALFASQAAAVIENAGLYKEIAQERDHSEWLASQLLALHKITKEIQSELDLPRLLNLISRLAAELLEADTGGILLPDDEKKNLTFKGSYKLSQQIVEGTRDVVGGSISGRVVETGEAIIANNIPNDARFYNPAADGEGLLAVISTPLWIGGEIVGTLDVHSKTDRFAFDQDDLQILSLLATQAASAIQNAKLFQQTHQRALTLEALHKTSLEITRYHHIPELVNSILKRAVELLQAKGGGIYLLDESGERVRLAALSDLPEHLIGMTREVGDDDISMIIKTKAPLAVSDYRNWPYRLRQYDNYGFAAVVGAPIIWQENIWGVIAVHDDVKGRNFDRQELNLLSHLGNMAAVALENAELATKDADKLRRLEQLTQANSEIMGNLADMSLDERLNLIAKYATEILDAEACGIFMVKRPDFLSLEAGYGHREGGFEKGREYAIHSGRQSGLTGHIAYESELFNSHGDDLINHFAMKWDEPYHPASDTCYSVLAISLKKKTDSDEELIGLLRVDNKKDKTGRAGPTVSFTREDEWILRLFANAAVVAIEAARLLDQVHKSYNAARVVAKVTVLEDLQSTLESIVQEIQNVLSCDVVTLYTYDQDLERFGFPPAMVGVKYPKKILEPEKMTGKSIPHNILSLDDLYVAENGSADPLMCDSFTKLEGILSSVGVPLVTRDSKVGVMIVSYRNPHRFADDELTNIRLFAYQAAVAIRYGQLYGETQKRARALQALYEAGRAATSSLNRDQILSTVVQQAWKLTSTYGEQARYSHLNLVDGNKLVFAATYPPEQLQILRDRIGDIDLESDQIDVTGRAVKTGQSQLIGDTTCDPDYIEFSPETHSELAVPIKVEGRAIGVINLEHSDYDVFDENDQLALEALTDQAAIAIQNAALQQVAVSLAGTAELEDVLRLIVTEAMKLTGTQESSILFWDPQAERFTRAMRIETGGTVEPYMSQARGQVGRARQIIEERHPIAIPDAQQVPDFNPAFLKKGYRATLGVPLVSQGEPIGVLYVRDNEPREFSERQITLLEGLASQAAVAIDRARQYEELKQTYDELKHIKGLVGARTAVAWMGMVSATWRHAIEGHAMTIEEEIGHVRTDSSPESLDLIARRLDKIQRLTRLILEKPITPPLSEEEGVESVAVNQLLQERLRQLWENEPHKSVQRRLCLRLNNTITVRASPEWLRRMFDVLVDNAVEAMATISRPRLTVSTRRAGLWAEIVFTDTGRGVSEDLLSKLFHEKIEKPQGAKGLGMGLLMAQTIAQTYGGEIRVESTNSTGTTMVVSLPIESKK